MSLPETFYIALCVTILLLGVVYWFWTQVQYLQRKVNLLDNVVYEIKTLVSNLPGSGSNGSGGSADAAGTGLDVPAFKADNEFMQSAEDSSNMQESYAPPPESIAGDLEAERLASENEFESFSGSANNLSSSEANPAYEAPPAASEVVVDLEIDDLQPGGLAVAAKPTKKSDAAIESPLNALSLKELKVMAVAQNIPGAGELKKKDLIRLLRDKVSTIINNDQPKVLSFDEVASPTFD